MVECKCPEYPCRRGEKPRLFGNVASMVYVLAILLVAGPAQGHHSYGTFDVSRRIELTGTITRVDFVNPHAWLHLTVPGRDGVTSNYRCEMRGATQLRRSGWAPGMFVEGEAITVLGAPDRVDPQACYVSTLIFADGTEIDRYAQLAGTDALRAANAPAPGSAAARTAAATLPRRPSGVPDLSGDWAVEQVLMTDPSGRRGAMVPAGIALAAEPGSEPDGYVTSPRGILDTLYSIYRTAIGAGPFAVPLIDAPVAFSRLGRDALPPFDQHPRMRCMTTSIVYDWYIEGVNRISQTGTSLTIEHGQHGLVRAIHLDREAHPEILEPTRGGHSIGRWDGDVLIVDTVGFVPGMLGAETPHGPGLRVVERFSLNADGSVLTREYAAEDPDYFVGEYRGVDVTRRSAVPFIVDLCAAGGEE